MSLKNAIGGVALIAGTAIGAAILALPVATAHLGFIQTVAVYCVCWFFMTLAALYLLETNLAVGHDSNLITMAQTTLGNTGKYFTWVLYLVLLYALLAAYLTGAGAWIAHASKSVHLNLSLFTSAIVATVLTVIVIFMGTGVTDKINRLLMVGLIGAFVSMIWIGADKLHVEYLLTQNTIFDLRPVPLIITAFGFAIVIPTLVTYLHGKPRQLFNVVLLGCILPLLVYIIWELTIIGTIPLDGAPGLIQIQRQELQQFESNDLRNLITDIPKALQIHLMNPWITIAASFFSIFALTTSLLGVCLSLFDFLADGLHIRKTWGGRAKLILITFVPPLVFVLFYPTGFSLALSFAGGIVALLLGILPALMAWRCRYKMKMLHPIRIVGGKPFLVLTIVFFMAVASIEIFNQYETWQQNHEDRVARAFIQE